MTGTRRRLLWIVGAVLLAAGIALAVVLLTGSADTAAPAAEATFAENPYADQYASSGPDGSTATVAAWIGFFALIATFIALSVCARRRRRRGDEGHGYGSQGADAAAAISEVQSPY